MAAELETHAVDTRWSSMRRVLPEVKLRRFDPFFALREQVPVRAVPRDVMEFEDYSHRTFEIVTYVIAGEKKHIDAFGRTVVLQAGDVQWITEGSGIVGSELPKERMTHEGVAHAFQLWINPNSSRNMERPHYQDVRGSRLPLILNDGRWIRLIAGSCGSLTSPIETGRPVLFAHVRLSERTGCTFPVPRGAIAILYAMTGDAELCGSHLSAHHVGVLRNLSGEISLEPSSDEFEGLILAATPMNDPQYRCGLAMNTRF